MTSRRKQLLEGKAVSRGGSTALLLLCTLLVPTRRPSEHIHGTIAVAGEESGLWNGTLTRAAMQKEVLSMFYHGYNNYKEHAFPHDELKPLTRTYTDSLGELGNVDGVPANAEYSGAALTLIDALSTLAVIGDAPNFEKDVNWLIENMSFDLDVRVNVFEANIRLLGGLLSAHMLAQDPALGPRLMPGGYSGSLLTLAEDLGRRLLPAFAASPTGLPFAWVNLRHGVFKNESVFETNTAAAGSFTIEMGVLSRLTGHAEFEHYARRSLLRLWAMRTPLGLFGTSIDMSRAIWLDLHGGIGASADSFFEYLLKAYILFGDRQFWGMFEAAYTAALQHYKTGAWYPSADIWAGVQTHMQFTSLQAFWPGMQVLAGDVRLAADTFHAFFSVWQRFGVLPERYFFAGMGSLHPTEHYYPLRPELLESAFYLHQATGDAYYLQAAQHMMAGLIRHTRVEGGFASIRSVLSMEKEDHMHSFFLAETCKYLFLMANDTFLQGGNFLFSTEGHPIPIGHPLIRRPPPPYRPPAADSAAAVTEPTSNNDQPDSARCAGAERQAGKEELRAVAPVGFGTLHSNRSALDARMCPDFSLGRVISACHILDMQPGAECGGSEHCGVDGHSCRRRRCSEHGYCVTPEQVQQAPALQQPQGGHPIIVRTSPSQQPVIQVHGVGSGEEVGQGLMRVIAQMMEHQGRLQPPARLA